MEYYYCYVRRSPIRELVVFVYLCLARIKHRRERRVIFVEGFVFLEESKDIIGCREAEVKGWFLWFVRFRRHWELLKEVFDNLDCCLFYISQFIIYKIRSTIDRNILVNYISKSLCYLQYYILRVLLRRIIIGNTMITKELKEIV